MTFEVFRCYFAIIGCALLSLFAVMMLIFKKSFPRIGTFFVNNEKAVVIFVIVAGIIGYFATVLGYFGVPKYVLDFDLFLQWSKIFNDTGFKGFMSEYPPLSLYQ